MKSIKYGFYCKREIKEEMDYLVFGLVLGFGNFKILSKNNIIDGWNIGVFFWGKRF